METEIYELEPQPRELLECEHNEDIYISIKIGNAQIGGNVVQKEDGTVLAKGGFTEPVLLGNSSELKGEILKVTTNILDVNPSTNNCVLTTNFLAESQKILFSKIDSGEAPLNGVASFVGLYLIRTFTILLGISILFIQSIASQNSKDLELKDLEIPTSPGFVLFDDTPSSIEKPSSPKALGISLLGLQNEGGAIEIAPYWLKDRSEVTAEEIFNKKNLQKEKKGGMYNPLLANLGISITAINNDSITKLAFGIRTRLIQNFNDDDVKKLNTLKKEIEDLLSETKLDLEAIENKRKEYSDRIAAPIFSLDLAGAFGGESNNNSFQDLSLNRWAFWVSGHFRLASNNLFLTALTRYVNSETQNGVDFDADLIDFGLRLSKDYKSLSISLEYLQRLNISSNDFGNNRFAAIGSYKIADGIYLTSTIGKNFDELENIILVGGLTFGISQKRLNL